MRLTKKQFIMLTKELAQTYKNIDPKIAQAEIDEAIQYARKKKSKK